MVGISRGLGVAIGLVTVGLAAGHAAAQRAGAFGDGGKGDVADGPVSAITAPEASGILFSETPDRAAPAALDDATVDLERPLYIFLADDPDFGQGSFAFFQINGSFAGFDFDPPFDALGTFGGAPPAPAPAGFFREGDNSVTAFVIGAGGFEILTASFTTLNAPPDLLDVLRDRGLDRFADAALAGGFGDLLEGPAEATVFAPSNDAIDGFLAGEGLTPQDLLADAGLARAVIGEHLVAGRFSSAALPLLEPRRTLGGSLLNPDAAPGDAVVINGAAFVTAPDVEASNGVLHEVDGVIVPPPSILATLADEGLTSFAAAAEAVGLGGALDAPGALTVLAPTNDAFEALAAGAGTTVEGLLADPDALAGVLDFHVAVGALDGATIELDGGLLTRSGEFATAAPSGAGLVINGEATVVGPDTFASNGFVHAIDAVLTPPTPVTPVLSYSLSADRGGALALDGAVVPSGEPLYVFLSTPEGAPPAFGPAFFFVNGISTGTDFEPPLDAVGSDPSGDALPLGEGVLIEGQNRAFVLDLGAGRIFEAAFTVAAP